jgi:tetratricopeptide (TPR) repeat protein
VSNRIGFGIVVGLFGILGSSAVLAQEPGCAGQKITKKVDKPIGAAEKAYQAKQWDEVIAKVAEAEAVDVPKSEFDKYWMHEFRGRAYLSKQQYPEAAADLEASLNSICMVETEKPARQKLLVQLHYQLKAYPKVIELGNKVLAANFEPELASYVGNAYYATDDFPNTKKVMGEVVAKQEAAGTKPEELTYRILQGACIKTKDNPCIVDMLEKLVANYPKPEYWQDLVALMLGQTKNNVQLLNIWRVAEGNNVLVEAAEYTEMAQLAIGQGLPGEAQAVLDKGFQKGVFTKGKEQANALLGEAKQAVALDKSTLDKQDAAAKAKPTGDNDVKLGAAYLSYAQYDKAIEVLQRGMSKGGVKNPDEANLLLGIAYLRSGKKPEAAKAFASVSQDPTYSRVARLWKLSTI